ncbi:YciI-like protein [Burkholderia gladioli]|uniref:YciI-like protein n=1 Tax=Burkholderia gladioli TaxID=28095 RepID=UPI0016406FB6|nr:YciI-like protein [Burkholderia gladioli]
MYYLLTYDLVDNYLERRGQYRDQHLALAQAATERGELLLAGALADPADCAVLVFTGASPAAAEAFANADPYVKNKLVRHWQVRQWNVAAGHYAKT